MSLVPYAILIVLAAVAIIEAIAFRVMKDEKPAIFPRVQPE